MTSSTLRSLAVERVKRDADLARNAMPDLATWVRWMSLAGNRDRRSWADQTATGGSGTGFAGQSLWRSCHRTLRCTSIDQPASRTGPVAVLHTGAHEAWPLLAVMHDRQHVCISAKPCPRHPPSRDAVPQHRSAVTDGGAPGETGGIAHVRNCALITECSVPHWFVVPASAHGVEGCGSANAKCVLRAKPVQPVQPVQPTTSQTVGGSYYNSNPAPPQDAATEVKEEVMDEEDSGRLRRPRHHHGQQHRNRSRILRLGAIRAELQHHTNSSDW